MGKPRLNRGHPGIKSRGNPGVSPYPEDISNATVAYKCNEASGNLSDSGSVGLTLVAAGSGATYSVTASGLFGAVSPGITFTSTSRATGVSATAAAFGANDVTIEYYFKSVDGASSDGAIINTRKADASDAFYISHRNSIDTILVRIATAADATGYTWTTPAGLLYDGSVHKMRITINRATNKMNGYLDGVSLGEKDISANGGATIDCEDLTLGNYFGGADAFDGTIFFFRYTVGSANQNIGGPGGG